MKTTKLRIEEGGLKKNDSKDLIFNMINQQINHYKLGFLSQWEKNHSTSIQHKENKINELRSKKQEIEAFFNEWNSDNPSLDISLSIEVKVMEKVPEALMA